jgi:hypothetical protein
MTGRQRHLDQPKTDRPPPRAETSWRPGFFFWNHETPPPAGEAKRASESGEGGRRTGLAGRGPRGYTRSDNRIREDVCEALTEHDGIDASDIEVTVLDGEVTLSGTVDDAFAKDIAESVASSCLGVRGIRSRLWLRQEERSGDPDTSRAGRSH